MDAESSKNLKSLCCLINEKYSLFVNEPPSTVSAGHKLSGTITAVSESVTVSIFRVKVAVRLTEITCPDNAFR